MKPECPPVKPPRVLQRMPCGLPLSCLKRRQMQPAAATRDMAYAHGLCIWPTSEALPAHVLNGHAEEFTALPADLTALRSWCSNSQSNLLTVIIATSDWQYKTIYELKSLAKTAYVVVWHPDAAEDPLSRIRAFQAGARIVTSNPQHLREALRLIASIRGAAAAGGSTVGPEEVAAGAAGAAGAGAAGGVVRAVSCPWCGLQGLTEHELWTHQPLYHIYERDLQGPCPVCAKLTSRMTRHISLTHGPHGPVVDERTGVYALAVVRRPSDGKFLLVQERYHEGYWIPGGGVDPGESLRDGVVREAWEEAGARIKVTGILTVESSHHGAWRRVIFLAEPDVPSLPNDPRVGVPGAGGTADPRVAEALCKTLPDVESAGACWAHAHEVPQLPLRSASEPLTWIPYVAGGGRVVPLPLEDPEACPDLARVFPDVPL